MSRYVSPLPSWADLAILAKRFPVNTLVRVNSFTRPRRVVGHGALDRGTRLGVRVSTDLYAPPSGWDERGDSLASYYAEDVDAYLDPKWSPAQKDAARRRADATTHRTNANLEHLRSLRGLFLFLAAEGPSLLSTLPALPDVSLEPK